MQAFFSGFLTFFQVIFAVLHPIAFCSTRYGVPEFLADFFPYIYRCWGPCFPKHFYPPENQLHVQPG
jgi:hypothetical protein